MPDDDLSVHEAAIASAVGEGQRVMAVPTEELQKVVAEVRRVRADRDRLLVLLTSLTAAVGAKCRNPPPGKPPLVLPPGVDFYDVHDAAIDEISRRGVADVAAARRRLRENPHA
jgi:hypothetical protein